MEKMRGIVLILGVLFLMGVVSAQGHICQGGNASIHGVFINGDCYNCGAGQEEGGSDGVCPVDYGAPCEVRDFDCEYKFTTSWSANSGGIPAYPEGVTLNVDLLSGGKNMYLVVKETGLSPGDKVNFNIKRKRTWPIPDDAIVVVSGTVQDTTDRRAIAVFPINEQKDYINNLDVEGGVEIYAISSRADGQTWPAEGFDDVRTKNLKINVTRGGKVYLTCADYTEDGNETCTDDDFGVGKREVSRQVGVCTYISTGSCFWNETASICVQKQGAERNATDNPDTCTEARTAACEYPTEEKYGSCETGDEFYRVSYKSNNPGACPSFETQPIPCPKTLRLPFFGVYGIAASLSLISLVYFLYRKKFLR